MPQVRRVASPARQDRFGLARAGGMTERMTSLPRGEHWLPIGRVSWRLVLNHRHGDAPRSHYRCWSRYAERMTVRDLLATLQRLPRDAELLAFEPGCEDYCEREVDDYLAW